MKAEDASCAVLLRVAQYCAVRAATFEVSGCRGDELHAMIEKNLGVELGDRYAVPRLEIARPAIVDGRMMPHEWIRTAGGVMRKTDAASHGDDHFFPGATDVAWDLAGTIVEWGLGRHATHFFLDAYRRASGDAAAARLPAYLVAYALFRAAYCKLASSNLEGSAEAARLHRDYLLYRGLISLWTTDARSVVTRSNERSAPRAHGSTKVP
jgi:hypothetical protein